MHRQYLLGFDVGSSSVKASLVDIDNGQCAASAFYPETEAPIKAINSGWAEQDPEMWWHNAKLALKKIMAETGCKGEDIQGIGISYQMHGLVCVDKDLNHCATALSGATRVPCHTARRHSINLVPTIVLVTCSTRQATLPQLNWLGFARKSHNCLNRYTR